MKRPLCPQFTEPGTYKYVCSIHPDMVGTITVIGTSE